MPSTHLQLAARRRIGWMPWAVVAVLAGLTVAAWWLLAAETERTARARFDRLTERINNTLRLRFNTAAHLLHGAAALPEASEDVTATEWSVYLRRAAAQLDSGVVGLGYVEPVHRADLEAVEQRVRAQGQPGFTIERAGNNPALYVVLAIEPQERNTGVLGLDIGSGTTRKSAAEAAARADEMVLSGRIGLDYEHRKVPGFLLFLPVYQKGLPRGTPAERLAAVQGWVYAPIRIDHLMTGIADVAGGQLDFEVFEGDGSRSETLLYDEDGHLAAGPGREITARDFSTRAFHDRQTLMIFGRQWTLRFSTRPEFERANFSPLPAVVLAGGLMLSALGGVLTWALVHSRRRALRLAEDQITGLRQAEEEARRLALVASRTSSGVVLTDTEWRVQWINAGFTRLFGFTLDEIRGRQPVTFMIGPETDPRTLEAMGQAGVAGRPYVGEVLNYAKDGRKVWVELEIQPVRNEQGILTGFMGLQLDITQRKQQAVQLREAKEAAERANVAKSQFLAMMSHEIRTPMNGVIGMASLLLDSPLTPDQRESAETIRQSGQALLTIINDILDFSKIESGRLELDHTEFSLRDCVEGAVDVLGPAAAAKQLDLICEIPGDVPAMVRGDPVRLRQVLVNLVGNAVKFTERGEVLVKVRVLARTAPQVDVVFTVWDTGIGIPAEHMEKLFQPFSQVDASMTRRFGGTGLGLAICRRLVELMGGGISVESEVGRGSSFSFVLRLQEIATGGPDQPAPPGEMRGRRVLIVEDNATSRRILSAMVRHWGLEAVAVDSAASALGQLGGTDRFDAAIIDLQMPELDGRALARSIREMPDRKDLPLVLLANPGRKENPGGHFRAILTKPVKPAPLFDALLAIFAKKDGNAAPVPPA
ncbi:MAG TPA: CHASE domain-containing protein [Lacunisphaera sp.]